MERTTALSLWLWPCVLVHALWFESAGAVSPIHLEPGKTFSALAAPATARHTYQFDAQTNQTFLIQVDQQGLDFIILLENPSGEVRSFNTPLLRDEREFILLENTTEGSYLLTVYSDEYTGATGAQKIIVKPLTDVHGPDVINAWRLMSAGAEANFSGGSAGWQKAIENYQEAAQIWANTGRIRERAQALFSIATIEYWQMYNWTQAMKLAAMVSSMYEEMNEPALSANALHLQAAALIELANEASASEAPELFEQALRLFNSAANSHKALGNLYSLAEITNNIGLTYFYMGNYEQASQYWNDAAAIFKNLDEWAAETNPIGNLAVVDFDEGHLSRSIDSLERLISLLPEDSLHAERARHLDNLANSNRLRGDLDEALSHYSEALRIHRDIEDKGEAWSLLGLGQTYFAIGNLELATDYLDQALPVARTANEIRAYEAIMHYRGNVAYLTGNYQSALDFHKSAHASSNSITNQIHLQLLMAKDLVAMERYSEATAIASQAKASAELAGSNLLQADSLQALGWLNVVNNEPHTGEALLENALAVYESLSLKGKRADTLNLLAHAVGRKGDLAGAVGYGEESIKSIESLRTELVIPELRAYFSAARRGYYDDQVGFLMALHTESMASTDEYLRAALSTSERARARMMADLLAEASVYLRKGMPPAMRTRLGQLNDQLADMRYQRSQLLTRANTNEQQLTRLTGQMAAIETDVSLLEAEFRRSDSRFASLTSPKTLSAAAIQRHLDGDTVLLQYLLGDEQSYVFVVSKNSIRGVKLANRSSIEAAARTAFNSLRQYQSTAAGRDQLTSDLNKLSGLVLEPVSGMLTKPRIVIAADGALQYVPFGVLPLGQDAGSPMVERFEIVNIRSMSTMIAQRERLDSSAALKTLAIFADPVFQTRDQRLEMHPPFDGNPARGASAASQLTRLPYTGREADTIAGLVPDGDRIVLRGFQANKRTLFDLPIDQYRYVHFATHGLIDSRYPSLSSLALSQFDEQGLELDGLLRLRDIYGLELNADLVVLSACETALGREIRGEGLLGLTQGFMYAGARRLVVSLWQVPDRATSELMAHFYRYLIEEQLTAPAALRKAQLSIASERRWSKPFFWGSFQLFGDWQQGKQGAKEITTVF
jgi:CHAT domain-containing protein